MRKVPSRITTTCPACGAQMVVHIRFPLPQNRGVKQPELIDWVCPSGCALEDTAVRNLLRL